MPYSGKDDDKLPDKVKKMGDGDREQWVAVFNDTYDACKKEGGDDCEGEAMKAAYGAVSRFFKRALRSILQLFGVVSRAIKDVESWDGSASNYPTTEAYCSACLIDVNSAAGRDTKAQDHCMLPVREAGDDADTYVRQAVHAAVGGHGISEVVKPDDVEQDAWDEAVKSAANKLVTAYGEMGEECPEAVKALANKEKPTEEKPQGEEGAQEEARRVAMNALVRALSINMVAEAAYSKLAEQDPMVWINDIYADDNGIFLIVSSEGQLYRVNATIKNGDVVFSDWKKVAIDFPEIAGGDDDGETEAQKTRPSFQIYRTEAGRYRWIGVSGSTVLNRMGEIDSSKLFDNFIAKIDAGEPYPIRQFYHKGEQFRTGQADFVARDGHLLITSGLYDDTELAKREIDARLKDPDYWGDSIGYLYQGSPEMLRVNDEIEIPVYTDGVLKEISTAPEEQCAAWFTNQALREVDRMLTGKALEAFVKLFDDDEDAAKKWLESNVDAANRVIVEKGMLARTKKARDGETPENPPASTEPAEPQELVIDDNTVALIAERVGANLVSALDEKFKPITDQLAGVSERVGKIETSNANFTARLEALEAENDDAERTRQEDMPRKTPLKVTYRPRVVNPPDPNRDEDDDPDMGQRAANVLGTLPIKY